MEDMSIAVSCSDYTQIDASLTFSIKLGNTPEKGLVATSLHNLDLDFNTCQCINPSNGDNQNNDLASDVYQLFLENKINEEPSFFEWPRFIYPDSYFGLTQLSLSRTRISKFIWHLTIQTMFKARFGASELVEGPSLDDLVILGTQVTNSFAYHGNKGLAIGNKLPEVSRI
mmetsp:Transcript_22063/g.33342  ORF Transcript_22063/g.33342 Transcript_22063/m.33342 type:complete len:171 (+) Transcript_22063:1826-2338(+)